MRRERHVHLIFREQADNMDTRLRSAWLSEFDDVESVARWAIDLGAEEVDQREIRHVWTMRQEALDAGIPVDYRLFVVERPRRRPCLEMYRHAPNGGPTQAARPVSARGF